jgi:hypothetical protein
MRHVTNSLRWGCKTAVDRHRTCSCEAMDSALAVRWEDYWAHIIPAYRLIRASAAAVHQAFTTAEAMQAWLPPEGMSATSLSVAF